MSSNDPSTQTPPALLCLQFLEKDRAYVAASCASIAMQASPFKSERTAALVSSKLKQLANHVRGTSLEVAFNSISEEVDEER